MLTLIAVHALLAGCAPALVQRLGRNAFYVLAAAPAAVFIWALSHTASVTAGGAITSNVEWVPGLKLELAFYLDTLSWVLCLLVGGVGALVLCYCARYFKNTEPALGRFAAVLTAFAGAMYALIVSDNMVVLFIAWELTTIFSYLLIGHYEDRKPSRRAAMQALIVTTFGGLAMLAGMVLIGEAFGSYQLSLILQSGAWQTWGAHPPATMTVAVLLLLLGALSKSALIPFHFWLPAAMAAPTPVSAYLHAAAMVKAGVFLVARLAPAMHEAPTWSPTIWVIGTATMLLGAYRALRQVDIKLMLAYGTVSQLGFLIVINGIGTSYAALAGLALLISHALFKAPLFLTVGIIDKATGTRDVRVLSGVGRQMPIVAATAIISAVSMSGLPFTAGFVGKETAFAALLLEGPQELALLAFLVVGSGLTFAYSARFIWGALATKRGASGKKLAPVPVRAVPVLFWLPGAILAACTILSAVFVTSLQKYLLPILTPYGPEQTNADPHLVFFAVNLALGVSALSWLIGGLLAAKARRAYKIQQRLTPNERTWGKFVDVDRAYRRLMRGVDATAVRVTGWTQRGSLPVFLGTTLIVLMALVWGHLIFAWPERMNVRLWDHPAQLVIGIVIAVASIAATRSRRRLRAVILVGVTGFGVGLNFVIFQAPDIALTQILVETVTLVVFVLVLRRLPLYFSARPLRSSRYVRMAIGIGTAVTLCLVAVAASNARVAAPIGMSLYEPSYAFGGGQNIVNVTLVDTRAWDTMGEISVVLVAATGVASLIFLRRREGTLARMSQAGDEVSVWGDASQPAHLYKGTQVRPGVDARNRARTWLKAGSTLAPRRRSVVLEVTTRFLFPVAMLFSIFLLFAGHNRPGGGFIAALVTGLALMVRYLAGGRYELGEAFPVQAGAMLGSGLFVAVASGIVPLAFGGTILQSAIIKFSMWPYGDVKIVTAMFFDIGVYLVVVGLMLDLLRTVGAEIDRQIEADTRKPVETGLIDMRRSGL